MVFDFTPERPVLNFGPRHHARWSDRRFLLWPSWAYRVVAPRVRQRRLNMLQRAVMGLSRAGLTRGEDIAEHLSVHTDLVTFIGAELTAFEYLDEHGLPTQRGLRTLEEDTLETQEMVAGYVFQDPWTGDLWPRFVEDLDYCELEYNDRGFPALLLGSRGRPRRFSAFTVLPRGAVLPAVPSGAAVVEAVAHHRRGLKFKDVDESDDEPIGDFAATGVQISRVSFVEEAPQPVFLTTYLYVPESGAGAMDWYACDPFGLGRSARLRRRVEAVMDETPGLFNVVNDLVGQTLHAGYEDQKRWLEGIRLKAELEVDRRLGVNIRSHASFDQLTAMESSRLEMRALGDECPQRKIDEALRAGVKVLESVFSSMATGHPLGDVWERVYVRRPGARRLTQQDDRPLLRALYTSAFYSVGFADPIPPSLLNVKPGQVRSVADYGDHWRLRPLITTTALLADRDPSHPLRRAAQLDATLLARVDAIAHAGGGAGHAHGPIVKVEHAEEHVDAAYAVVATLLGLERAGQNSELSHEHPRGVT